MITRSSTKKLEIKTNINSLLLGNMYLYYVIFFEDINLRRRAG